MCELFAMSAKYPSAVWLSLEKFSRHGGLSGPHRDACNRTDPAEDNQRPEPP
jgi:predicted glutamine amidotransferase